MLKPDKETTMERPVPELQQSYKIEQNEWSQFGELLNALAREHKLLCELTSQRKEGKLALSILPPGLQEPMDYVEEFRDALLRILRKGGL